MTFESTLEAFARLRERVRGHAVKMSHVPETCELCAIRVLLDAHAALEAAHTEARNSTDYARGVADERARVVADLRKQNQLVYPSARFLANRYERGEHAHIDSFDAPAVNVTT